jgi:predicted FMN-binding regulatory protein PaiB
LPVALNNPLRYFDPDGNFEYETELLRRKIKIKISDNIEKTDQDKVKKNLDDAIAKINAAADKLTSDQNTYY